MVCGRTPCCVLIFREGETAFTVLSVVLVVVVARNAPVLTCPPKSCAVILTVKRKTLLDLLTFVWIWRIPTVVSDGALVSLFALLIWCSKLWTLAFPGPYSGSLAKELRVTIIMFVAQVCLWKPIAFTVFAVQWFALPWRLTGTAVIKQYFVARDRFTVSFCFLMVDLGVRYYCFVLVSLCACLLRVLINPCKDATEEIKFASHLLPYQFGLAPKLIPVTIVQRYFLVRLLLVMDVA